MLPWLLHWMETSPFFDLRPDWLASVEKITFRGSLAAMLSFAMALLLGPRIIGWLGRHFREPNVSDSAAIEQLHRQKHATPTMGGLFIVAGLLGGLAAFADLANPYVQAALVVTVGLSLLGAADDLIKLRGLGRGLSPRAKLLGQTVTASLVALLIWQHHAATGQPFTLRLPPAGGSLDLGVWFMPLAVLVIVGASNAVNLTDGLDGLAGGCLVFATGAMAVVAYAAGNARLADYLHLPHLAGVDELLVLCGGMIGGLLGFLWFNCHPAQVFMGDTGSLPLGGLLGLLAVASRQELLLVVIGGVFVAEAASVILQVASYRWRRRRIFLCAPLHHHFQLLGWPESRVVVRFWIASAFCALVGLAALKLHVTEPTDHSLPARTTAEKVNH
ncbi:MAG: phospho-N-acetylmuramoyl-pentapeptide-transferase [Thermoguttaceae bacterium]